MTARLAQLQRRLRLRQEQIRQLRRLQGTPLQVHLSLVLLAMSSQLLPKKNPVLYVGALNGSNVRGVQAGPIANNMFASTATTASIAQNPEK